MNQDNSIKIKKNTKIGALDAETDIEMLKLCFVDGGDLQRLLDCQSPESIVLGRTGSGKSALLLKIENTQSQCKKLDPSEISFKYIENSKIIKFLEEINVNLDLFYRLLWRHILAVELLTLRYDLDNESKQNKMLTTFESIFNRNANKRKAIEYLREWGDRFWEKTEVRIREITNKLERDISSKFSTSGLVNIEAGSSKNMSSSERVELAQKAADVVNQIQIKELSDVLGFLAEDVFDDEKRKHYILIDQLDENWADTETRCRLIRALIEEIKTFRKIKPAKIIIALRVDLLNQVFNKTRDNGFQEEKYEAYILPIKWTKNEIMQLINVRINYVFERQYTKQNINFNDVFPSPKDGQTAEDYILERTAMRPRDAMQFVNEAFLNAIDSPRISWRAIKAAEANYSKKRLNSLTEEWGLMYPSLKISVNILNGFSGNFGRSRFTQDQERFSDVVYKILGNTEEDEIKSLVNDYFEDTKKSITEADIVTDLIQCFYRIGLIGVKLGATETFLWSYIDQPTISKSDAKRAQSMKIHKMYWRALDVSDERRFES